MAYLNGTPRLVPREKKKSSLFQFFFLFLHINWQHFSGDNARIEKDKVDGKKLVAISASAMCANVLCQLRDVGKWLVEKKKST